MRRTPRWFLLLPILLGMGSAHAHSPIPEPVAPLPPLTLGVLAYLPKEQMSERYGALTQYLSHALRGTPVELRPLAYSGNEVERALAGGEIDLLLTNPAHFIRLRADNRLTGAFVTQITIRNGLPTSAFGGVIFTRADYLDIRELKDLRGRRVAAADPRSLGGYQAQLWELRKAGIEPHEEVSFLKKHDRVVRTVLDGEAEAGFVRTGVIEGMIQRGELTPGRLRILNAQRADRFPFQLSTRLYPEWPLVALPHVETDTVRRIASALLALEPDHPAAHTARISGFAPPADYHPVEELARGLQLPPYDQAPQFTLSDVWERFREALIVLALSLVTITLLLALLVRRNRQLSHTGDALRKSEERMAEAQRVAQLGHFSFDIRGANWSSSKGLDRIFGIDEAFPRDVRGWLTIVHPQFREEMKEYLYEEVLGKLRRFDREYKIITRDQGEERWVYGLGELRFDRHGNPVELFGTIQDITDDKRVQARLAHSERMFRSLVENAQAIFWRFDLERGRFTYMSPQSEQMLGYPAKSWIDLSSWVERIHPEDRKWASEYCGNATAKGEDHTFEYRSLAEDGRVVWIRDVVTVISDDEGTPREMLGIMFDTTEEKATEEALRVAKAEADEANRAKSEFLATMSHEIRTPMNAILGVADLFAETEMDEEQNHYVELFTSAGEALLRIINDILDISKIEAGRVELEHQPLSLRRVAYDAVEIIEARAREKELRLLTFGFSDLPRYVVGDRARLSQVLINLLGNAVKFTERGTVALLTEGEKLEGKPGDNGEWRITFHVVDTGIGIPETRQAQVFEEFSQADSSTTRRYGGTGLGLAISRRLIELMSGELRLHSREGTGSTFSLTLPLREAGPLNPPDGESLRGSRVVTVHDHPIHSDFFEEALLSWGASVEALEVEDDLAGKPLERLGEAPAELVVVHHENLADDTVIEQLERLRRAPEAAQSALIVVSGKSMARDLPRRLREIGAIFIPDRSDDEALRRGVKLALQRRRPPARPVIQEHPVHTAQEALRILLAEDGEDNIELFRAFLARTPHEVDVVTDGELAVERYVEELGRYDLIFMDIQMPVKDGYTAVREIRQWERESGAEAAPIIALTAHATTEHRDRALEVGCDDHLTKPVKKAALLEAVERYGAPSRAPSP